MRKRQATEKRRKRVEALERPQYGWIWKPLLGLAGLYLLTTVGLGIWWSRPPAVVPSPAEDATAPGSQAPAALRGLVATLLDKPGGYLRNDIAPPGLWLDNMPAWELGVLHQARRLGRALPAVTGDEAAAFEAVRARLEGDGDDWFYPSTEHRLEQARVALTGYLEAADGAAAPGGIAGLAPWLSGLADDLDELGRRLSASVGNPEALADLDLEAQGLPRETPWYRVDNVFFEARGQAWAAVRLLEAVRRDRRQALERAGLLPRWEALEAELSRSQRRLWSPVVLNGSGFGLFANHSLVMANHVLRARDLARALADAGGAAEDRARAPAEDAGAEAPEVTVEPEASAAEASGEGDPASSTPASAEGQEADEPEAPADEEAGETRPADEAGLTAPASP